MACWGCTDQGGESRTRQHATHTPSAPAHVHPQALCRGPLRSARYTCPARNPGLGTTLKKSPIQAGQPAGGQAYLHIICMC